MFAMRTLRKAIQIQAWLTLIMLFSLSFKTFGQTRPDETGEQQASGSETATAAGARDELLLRLEAQETKTAELEALYQQKIAEQNSKIDSLTTRIDQYELEKAQQREADLFGHVASEPQFEKSVRFHGFFDLTFAKNFFPGNPSLIAYMHDSSTFLMSDIAVYLEAEMTRTLSATLELGFSFLPNGQVRSHEITSPDGSQKYSSWAQDETWMTDTLTTEFSWMNGVVIERAHLTYAPRDWLQIIAGKYLTPYGIWNVEHGPTVVIPVHVPYLMIRGMLPSSQLGLQALGRLFINYETYFDYVLTISNGRSFRSPLTDSGDTDENKAIGVGLTFHIDKPKWNLEIGAYGYIGTDAQRVKSGTIDTTTKELNFERRSTGSAMEKTIASHLLLEIFGLRLQGEFIFTRVDQDLPRPLWPSEQLNMVGDFTPNRYFDASYTGFGVYGMLSYQLPLKNLLGQVKVIPYVMLEDSRAADTKSYMNMRMYRGGVNVRPSPFTAIKLEYNRVLPMYENWGDGAHMTMMQLAVSF